MACEARVRVIQLARLAQHSVQNVASLWADRFDRAVLAARVKSLVTPGSQAKAPAPRLRINNLRHQVGRASLWMTFIKRRGGTLPPSIEVSALNSRSRISLARFSKRFFPRGLGPVATRSHTSRNVDQAGPGSVRKSGATR